MVMDRISALMDGELDDRDALREIGRLKTDERSRELWDEFHMVGDALRGEPVLSSAFSAGFSKRLAEEPTVLAPRRMAPKTRRVTTYALSAAASLSAAALVAWVAVSPMAPTTPQLASAPAPAPVQAAVELVAQPLRGVPSDGRMNEYLLAHEGLSPGSVLQGVAPYIRTVTAIRQGDGR